jgi:8-amino-7-oxononanoate synthase
MPASSAVRPEPGTWLARWLEACVELDRLQAQNPMLDAVIEEVDGRRIRVGDRWLIDFASCNYLGLDLDREVIEGIPAFLDRWGTHPGWSRMLGSPVLYEQIEAAMRELLGAEDVLLLPTLTHIHAAVIPVLASGGTVLLDARAHKTIHDGAVIARAHGARLARFAHDDPGDLERLLRQRPPGPRLVCLDGINSMTGNPPPWPTCSPWPRPMTPPCTWTTGTASGWSASAAARRPAPMACAATGSSATSASATTGWC